MNGMLKTIILILLILLLLGSLPAWPYRRDGVTTPAVDWDSCW